MLTWMAVKEVETGEDKRQAVSEFVEMIRGSGLVDIASRKPILSGN